MYNLHVQSLSLKLVNVEYGGNLGGGVGPGVEGYRYTVQFGLGKPIEIMIDFAIKIIIGWAM